MPSRCWPFGSAGGMRCFVGDALLPASPTLAIFLLPYIYGQTSECDRPTHGHKAAECLLSAWSYNASFARILVEGYLGLVHKLQLRLGFQAPAVACRRY
jgi:hypothetical protein